MTSNSKRIKDLIDIVADEQIAEVELRDETMSVRVLRRAETVTHRVASPTPSTAEEERMAVASRGTNPAPAARNQAQHTAVAPMSGTFHRSAGVGGEPIVAIGSKVSPGALLCVIEAMKILNDVTTDQAGVVEEVLCEDGQAVEQGQGLFIIRIDGGDDV